MSQEPVFQKIVAGCDGKQSGQDALALANVLSRLDGSDLLAVGVYVDPMLPFPPSSSLRDVCEQFLRADRDALAPHARIRAVAAISPASALAHVVEREHADLLVLGSYEHVAAGRVRAGRHARQLLNDAPCAIALAPRGFAIRAFTPRRILVGFDGSPEATDAFSYARRLGEATGASLRVVTVIDPLAVSAGAYESMVYLPHDREVIVERMREESRERLAALVADAAGVETEVVDGDPAMVLCDMSRAADLLVLGSRHWGPIARLVVGSTGEHAVRHAHCSMILVPRRGEQPGAPAREAAAAHAQA